MTLLLCNAAALEVSMPARPKAIHLPTFAIDVKMQSTCNHMLDILLEMCGIVMYICMVRDLQSVCRLCLSSWTSY